MAVAQAKGLSPDALVREALDKILAESPALPAQPKKSAYGLLFQVWPGSRLRRKSTRTAARCFAASARIFRDRRRCRYAYRLVVSAQKSAAIDYSADIYGRCRPGRQRHRSIPHQPCRDCLPGRKNRLPVSAYEDLKAALADPAYVIEEAPFTAGVVEALRQVPRAEVPDMPDRIVAAIAVFLRVPVISRDGRIRSSSLQTVW